MREALVYFIKFIISALNYAENYFSNNKQRVCTYHIVLARVCTNIHFSNSISRVDISFRNAPFPFSFCLLAEGHSAGFVNIFLVMHNRLVPRYIQII